jgi:hypothetical protein
MVLGTWLEIEWLPINMQHSNKTSHHVLLLCWIDSTKLCVVSLWLKGSSHQLNSHVHSTHGMYVCAVCVCGCMKFDDPWPRHVHISIHFVNWAYLGLLGTCTMADAHPGWSLWENKGVCFLGYLIINRRKCVYRKWGSYDAFQNIKIWYVKISESFIGVRCVFCVNMD